MIFVHLKPEDQTQCGMKLTTRFHREDGFYVVVKYVGKQGFFGEEFGPTSDVGIEAFYGFRQFEWQLWEEKPELLEGNVISG